MIDPRARSGRTRQILRMRAQVMVGSVLGYKVGGDTGAELDEAVAVVTNILHAGYGCARARALDAGAAVAVCRRP